MNELPILRRIDKNDGEAIQCAIDDGFDFIGTLHTYVMNMPDKIRFQVARRVHRKECIAIGLSELRHSRLYADRKIPFRIAQRVYEERIHFAFDKTTVFVAVHEDAGVVGFASLRENEIDLIAVSKAWQGQGVGRALVDKCVAQCRERGYKQLIVKTQGSNSQARSFYEKVGFQRTTIGKDFHKHEGIADRQQRICRK